MHIGATKTAAQRMSEKR